MKIDWTRTQEFGDCDVVGRLTDGRWFWTWNTGSWIEQEKLLEMGGEDGEDGGQVFDSYEDLMNTLKCREDLFEMVRKRFGHLTGHNWPWRWGGSKIIKWKTCAVW